MAIAVSFFNSTWITVSHDRQETSHGMPQPELCEIQIKRMQRNVVTLKCPHSNYQKIKFISLLYLSSHMHIPNFSRKSNNWKCMHAHKRLVYLFMILIIHSANDMFHMKFEFEFMQTC